MNFVEFVMKKVFGSVTTRYVVFDLQNQKAFVFDRDSQIVNTFDIDPGDPNEVKKMLDQYDSADIYVYDRYGRLKWLTIKTSRETPKEVIDAVVIEYYS